MRARKRREEGGAPVERDRGGREEGVQKPVDYARLDRALQAERGR